MGRPYNKNFQRKLSKKKEKQNDNAKITQSNS